MSTELVFAHVGDVLGGTYLSTSPCSPNNMKFLVAPSARTANLTEAMYKKATAWNGYSSNVNVSVTMYTTGMSDAGFIYIRGDVLGSGTYGKTIFYDSQGNVCDSSSNCYTVVIYINTDVGAYQYCTKPTESATKTIIHEVGHALKMAHPAQNSSYTGHTYSGGRPYAVMNQGDTDESCVAPSVALHDINNLKYKWGN